MSPALHSVLTEHDTHGARLLAKANDPERGLVVAAASPDPHQRFELGWALLEALGKRHDVSGHGRHDELNWEVLHAWLIAHDVHTLVLLDAQWLPPRLVADIAGLVATCGLDVWLVAHRPVVNDYLDALAVWPYRAPAGADLARLIYREPGAEGSPSTSAPWFPDVPADNWPTFRHACALALSPGAFEIVDERFRRSVALALEVFADQNPSEASVLRHLRQDLDTCVNVAEMTTVMRAVQVAAHRSGWLVQVNVARLRNTAELMSRAAITSPETWRRLRAYRYPFRGASVALAAAGLNVGEMESLHCADIESDGRTVRKGGHAVLVPVGAEIFVRAQLLFRQIQGAESADPFFADDRGALRSRDIADALRLPASELGVPVIDIATSRKPDPESTRWRDRWGITVQRLT